MSVFLKSISFSNNNKVGSSMPLPTVTTNPDTLNGQINGLNNSQVTSSSNNNLTGNTFVLPTSARKVRDSGSLLFLLAFISFLVYIIVDGMQINNSDINLIIHGHDSFGNICGRNNRPIRLVEKSGQNYTQKPYTKYTLINSQFERYSLLPSYNGDMFYVKERAAKSILDHQAAERHRNSLGEGQQIYDFKLTSQIARLINASQTASTVKPTASRGRRAAAASSDLVNLSSSALLFKDSKQAVDDKLATNSPLNGPPLAFSRPKRMLSTLAPTAPIDFESLQKNRTLLNNLKSSLMYQYPPMHGYNSSLVELQYQASRASSSGNHLERSLGGVQLGAATYRGPPSSVGLPSNYSFVSPLTRSASSAPSVQGASRRPASAPPMATTSDLATAMATSQRRLLALATTATATTTTTTTTTTTATATADPTRNQNSNHTTPGTTIANNTSGRSSSRTHIFFDDLLGTSESDHYDHMLVTPVNTNLHHYDPKLPPLAVVQHKPQPQPSLSLPPDVFVNHNEVNNQLLYLTECVESCPVDHIELIFYRCIPNNWRFSLFPNAINVTRTFIDDILTDVSHCYRELIYTFSLALVLSISLLILLRFLASIIIWTCLTLLILLFLALASYSWLNYYYQILDLNNLMPHDSVYAEKLALSDKWLIGSIFLTFLAFATIGTVLFMRRRILLVTMLFKESGKAISDMPLLLLQPLLTFAALISITVAWSIGLICLQSMKTPVVDFSTGFVVFKAETLYKIMKWYHIFAFLWVSHFAIACQHYVIGASVSKWYFSSNRYNLNSPIGSSISELILYYLGSVALGSFLVAIFKVIRIVTRQIQFLVQRNCISGHGQAANQDVGLSGANHNLNSSASCCGSFTYMWRLFIWFFDNIVMIINRDAYVEIAIHGHSFLTGARRAFTVLASNPLRLIAIKSVSNILLMVAKICVVFGTVSMAMILLDEKNTQLNYSWSPVVISAIYAYIVAHWFLSVYEMVIDALFICYCEDYEQAKSRELSTQLAESHFMRQILTNGQIF